MKQEFDMVKALHTLTYDLESESGQYNMGRMFNKCLDKAANAGVDYFAQMTCVYKELRLRKLTNRTAMINGNTQMAISVCSNGCVSYAKNITLICSTIFLGTVYSRMRQILVFRLVLKI